jgi:hypothetical protein
MSTQPEALRLADELDAMFGKTDIDERVTAELRRLHEINQELLAALQRCSGYWEAFGSSETRSFVRAAIAKAEGQT